MKTNYNALLKKINKFVTDSSILKGTVTDICNQIPLSQDLFISSKVDRESIQTKIINNSLLVLRNQLKNLF